MIINTFLCKSTIVIGMLLLTGLNSCEQPPNERFAQYTSEIEINRKADSLFVKLKNPVPAPLQFLASSQNDDVQKVLAKAFPFVLSGYADTTMVFIASELLDTSRINFSTLLGDPEAPFTPPSLELPFPKGKTYKVLQGYNGEFSHTSDYSRFALDFDLAIGDTIVAADNGFVVGVVDEYKDGGNSPKWRDFANYITLYHPDSGALTQYAHLDHEGSLVSLGDTVIVGQPIALSGNTGFSTIPHLHFNVLRSLPGKIISTPVGSIGPYQGEELTIGKIVTH